MTTQQECTVLRWVTGLMAAVFLAGVTGAWTMGAERAVIAAQVRENSQHIKNLDGIVTEIRDAVIEIRTDVKHLRNGNH